MKRILIINGNPKEEKTEFDRYCEELAKELSLQGNEVRFLTLRDKKISDCIGCYACWLKTPGICALKDDQEEILKGYVWSDFIVLASPVIMGFVSSLLKKANDRMLPLVHPFLKLNNDRMAHYPRYDKEYKVGLMVDDNDSVDEEDIEIISKVYNKAEFIKTMKQSVREVSYEINNF